MAMLDSARQRPPHTAFYNDPFVRGIIYQVVVGVLLVTFIAWIVNNTSINLAAQGKTTGFDFLGKTAGFPIGFSLFEFTRASTYWQAFLVGITNTLLVAVIGIFLATIMGFSVGIARLSSNYLISRLAAIFIEIIRNIPLLLQLFFWYFAVLKTMPAVKDSFALPLDMFINQRGIYVPRPLPDAAFNWVYVAIVAGLIGAFLISRWAKRRLEMTGKRFPVTLSSIALMLALVVLAWFVGGTQITFDPPVLQRFNFQGGMQLPPEFVALAFGLSVYYAAFIGETVRAGILAVNHGQTEAAQSLGLKDGDRLRLVVIPQAMRVIVPPLTSQFLNLTKDSSLGSAIGYAEVVNVFAGTALGQSGRAIEVIAMTMAFYLLCSLLTSLVMNWYNARVALVER